MDVQYVSSENFSTSLKDTTSKYGNDGQYSYKKEFYQYSDSNGAQLQNSDRSVNQLDALLEDLKNERKQTRETDIVSSTTNYRTIEPTGTMTKNTQIFQSEKLGSTYPIELKNITQYNTQKINRFSPERTSTIQKDEYQKNVAHSSSRNISNNTYESKSLSNKLYNSNTETELVPSLLENDVKSLTLSDDILPIPGTKVTTTVRTYTYEIPADSSVINTRTLLYKSNATNHETHQELDTPQTVVFNTESYATANGSNNMHRPLVANQVYEVKDTREVTAKNDGLPLSTKTIIYKTNTTEHSTQNHIQPVPLFPQNVQPLQEYRNSPHIPHFTLNQSNSQDPYVSYPQNLQYSSSPSNNNYYYHVSSGIVNTMSPGKNGQNDSLRKLSPSFSGNDKYPYTTNTSNLTYKNSTSTLNSRQGPDYGAPSSRSGPLPFDGLDNTDANPPAQLNELMETLGNGHYDKPIVETRHRIKKEVETAIASPNQQKIPSVNKAGQEVYYPPGHEWLSKREESGAAYSAQGRYAKASGMYEYESGYKSKTKTKSGGAVVPVCLPLCCAMPCSIM